MEAISAGPGQLPRIVVSLTFDDRLQEVRIFQEPVMDWDFLSLKYKDDDGFALVKAFRKDWADIVKI